MHISLRLCTFALYVNAERGLCTLRQSTIYGKVDYNVNYMPKPSPHKTDLTFTDKSYALFASCWIMLANGIMSQYKITLSDCRALCSLEALMLLFGPRLNGKGISAADIGRISLFDRRKITRMLLRLSEAGLIQYTEEINGIHIIRYYKFTKRGKEVVNKLCDTDKVNEQ